MLTIRRHQAALFTQLAVDRFVDELLAHFRAHLPGHAAALGDEGTRSAIRYGIGRARSYGIESEAGARVFVQLMFVLGPGFDADPKLPWAAEILLAGGDEAPRVGALFHAAERHLRERAAREGGTA